METISIPSPSVFLRSPVIEPTNPVLPPTKHAKRKPSMPAKPKTTKAQPDGVTKPKQSKSRNGCVTCKAKRLKCDETKPTCQQCHKRNVECGGYKKDFKWRTFEETTFTSKPLNAATGSASSKSKKSPSSNKPVHSPIAHSPGSSELSGTSTTPIAFPNTPHSSVSTLHPFSPIEPQAPVPHIPPPSPSFNFINVAPPYTSGGVLPPISPALYGDQSSQAPTVDTVNSNFDNGRNASSGSISSGYSSGQSPRLIDLLLPGTDLSTPPQYTGFHPQSDVTYQPTSVSMDQDNNMERLDDEEVEEIIRNPYDPMAETWLVRADSPTLSSPKSDSGSDTPATFMFNQPKLCAGSPEMLMQQFDKSTCGILSVRDGPTENPWRTVVWPLARDSPALFHAISSMTAFHSSKMKPELKFEGMDHMRKSIGHLAKGIANMRVDAALATTLVLAFAESWDVHVSTGIEHLRGARILVNQALATTRQQTMAAGDIARIKFLCNSWVYMDVIARLTSVDVDEVDDGAAGLWSQSNFLGNTVEIDPLMGCASTLFPIIGRVANLVRKVRKSKTNTINIISQANDLKTALEEWVPPKYFNKPEDPTCDVLHSLQTAEAYRWATILYLHQAVPEIPSRTSGQLAQKVLRFLATVPLSSRTIIVQIYPLLAAGCEASNQEDRGWVRERWTVMSQRMQIGNIDRCLEVVKEVWDRRDRFKERVRLQNRGMQPGGGDGRDFVSSAPGLGHSFSFEQNDAADMSWGLGSDMLSGAPDLGLAIPVDASEAIDMDVDASALDEQELGLWDQEQAMQAHARRSSSRGSKASVVSPVDSMVVSPERGPDALAFMDWPPDGMAGARMRRTNEVATDVAKVRAGRRSLHGMAQGLEKLHFERTVRGRQHWVGVMKDWNWEVLLG